MFIHIINIVGCSDEHCEACSEGVIGLMETAEPAAGSMLSGNLMCIPQAR